MASDLFKTWATFVLQNKYGIVIVIEIVIVIVLDIVIVIVIVIVLNIVIVIVLINGNQVAGFNIFKTLGYLQKEYGMMLAVSQVQILKSMFRNCLLGFSF